MIHSYVYSGSQNNLNILDSAIGLVTVSINDLGQNVNDASFCLGGDDMLFIVMQTKLP